jgi:hypothetical protein
MELPKTATPANPSLGASAKRLVKLEHPNQEVTIDI